MEGADVGDEGDDNAEEYSEYSDSSYYSEDSDEDHSPETIEQIPIVLHPKLGLVYYVVSFDGQCAIKEINPTEDEHALVAEVQT